MTCLRVTLGKEMALFRFQRVTLPGERHEPVPTEQEVKDLYIPEMVKSDTLVLTWSGVHRGIIPCLESEMRSSSHVVFLANNLLSEEKKHGLLALHGFTCFRAKSERYVVCLFFLWKLPHLARD